MQWGMDAWQPMPPGFIEPCLPTAANKPRLTTGFPPGVPGYPTATLK